MRGKCNIPQEKVSCGHGSKSRTPSEHPNPHENRLKWVVHLAQNGINGFDPQSCLGLSEVRYSETGDGQPQMDQKNCPRRRTSRPGQAGASRTSDPCLVRWALQTCNCQAVRAIVVGALHTLVHVEVTSHRVQRVPAKRHKLRASAPQGGVTRP